MSTVAIISAVAGKKGLEKVVGDIYDASKGQLRMRLKRWKAKKNIGVIYTKIKNIRKVKTILQPEKAVDLLKFYYPCKVKIDDKPKTIRDISELHWDGNIVIKGTVGQGKSIFFRYLASREMVKGEKIPLFVELRRIGKGEKLLDHLIDEADALGMKGINQETFLWLAQEGKVVLLLDAFDEVSESERTRITNEIERLAKRYEYLQILISSRPNSGIENSPFFRVFELAQLEEKEYEDAIVVMAEEDVAGNIIKSVKSSRSPVRGLLTTPLMVALLIVRHRIEQAIPENLIGFYQGLFTLLISRHDKMKGGYTRPRKSGLGDSSLENLFEGICFLTRKEGKGVFVRRDLTNYAKESAQLSGLKCDPDNVILDIEKITCLILEEGKECRFLHKSVQEYHAACFIKNQPDKVAQRFYGHVAKLESEVIEHWNGELSFLQMIDRYRFLKLFLIPSTSKILGLDERNVPKNLIITQKMIVGAFRGLAVYIFQDNNLGWGISSSTPLMLNYKLLLYIDIDIDFFSKLQLSHNLAIKEYIKPVTKSTFTVLSEQSLVKPPLGDLTQKVLKQVHAKLLAMKKYIKGVEERKAIFEF